MTSRSLATSVGTRLRASWFARSARCGCPAYVCRWVVGSRNSESAIWPARCAAAGCHGGVSAAR